MMNDYAIRVENLAKRYRIGSREEQRDTLVGTLSNWVRQPGRNLQRLYRLTSFDANDEQDVVWALRDVSFNVQKGEVFGVIGRNGAGKSTLLKILSRITYPTSGRVEIRGRVSSLLEVGTGFHPELTGRENIYLNGTILGMTKTEIDRKFDEIVDFSGVEKFIDTPVKHYSSGMGVRLAFSVAAYLEPEILLVDEVLAVGDLEFQKKCLGKMGQVAAGGRTVLFVSHNLNAVETLCSKSLFLEKGSIVFSGVTPKALSLYIKSLSSESDTDIVYRYDRKGSGEIRFVSVEYLDPSRNKISSIESGQPLIIRLGLQNMKEFDYKGNIDISVAIRDVKNQTITTLSNFFFNNPVQPVWEQNYAFFDINIDRFWLLAENYKIDLWMAYGSQVLDYIRDAATLEVGSGFVKEIEDARKPIAERHGSVFIPHSWHVVEGINSQSKC